MSVRKSMHDLSLMIDRKIERRARLPKTKVQDLLIQKKFYAGLFIILLAIASKYFNLLGSRDVTISIIAGVLLISDEHIVDAIAAYRKPK